jgi:hypothetical protein
MGALSKPHPDTGLFSSVSVMLLSSPSGRILGASFEGEANLRAGMYFL